MEESDEVINSQEKFRERLGVRVITGVQEVHFVPIKELCLSHFQCGLERRNEDQNSEPD